MAAHFFLSLCRVEIAKIGQNCSSNFNRRFSAIFSIIHQKDKRISQFCFRTRITFPSELVFFYKRIGPNYVRNGVENYHQFSSMWLIFGNYTKYVCQYKSSTHSIRSMKKKTVHLSAIISIFNWFWCMQDCKKRIPEAIIIHLWSTSIPATACIPPFHANWIDRNWIISLSNSSQECIVFVAICAP